VKAVYYEGGGRFALREVEPRPPEHGEVRLDVAYCGVCGTDLHIAHGAMDHRVKAPQVIGHEMSGTVAELGPGVAGFEIGEPVVVRPLDTRGETPADNVVEVDREVVSRSSRVSGSLILRDQVRHLGDRFAIRLEAMIGRSLADSLVRAHPAEELSHVLLVHELVVLGARLRLDISYRLP
jgi:Alcohol dehydrogenase GroES-like domain